MKEPNMFHNYETEKITHKARYATENLQSYRVVQFFCPRSLCTTTHLMLFSERSPIYVSWMMMSGKTKVMFSCSMKDNVEEKDKWPCGVWRCMGMHRQ